VIGFLRRRAAVRSSPHPRDERSDAALRSQDQNRRRLSWSRVLIWFMRILALLWIARGLSYWALILGAGEAGPAFEDRLPGVQATIVYFAVIDLIAAIGLWLTTNWGGVLWLLAVMSHLILAAFVPAAVAVNLVLGLIYAGLVLLYLGLSYLAGGEEQ
jgi:fatty acid desaturase